MISNVDVMICDDKPYIIEIGARMGATCLPEIISIYNDFNAYEFIINLALGEPVSLNRPLKNQANAALLLFE
ncbi:MAG: hypothetical protein U5K72_03550 [Balneolaceae bacterium]|nr:hypothetical protein [Balneolaceae bacterium]